ncbi:MAG: hypothetical protein SPL08_05360 [Pseudomonadota bacterium]|nr:hypothetical protein [Pseudomonadota bacterium]
MGKHGRIKILGYSLIASALLFCTPFFLAILFIILISHGNSFFDVLGKISITITIALLPVLAVLFPFKGCFGDKYSSFITKLTHFWLISFCIFLSILLILGN